MKKWFLSTKVLLVAVAMMVATGCGQDPKLPEIPGVKGPQFNLLDGKVMITLKLLKANLNLGAKVPIPKTKESFFEVSPNVVDGGTLVVFHIDVDDLASINIGVGDGNTLPDGRPIPGVAGGVLENSLRFDTELLDLSFYYHKTLFGIYLPLGWDTQGMAGYWNIVYSGKNVGMLGLVASDENGNGSGIMLFVRLNQLKDKQIKRMIKLSKKNSNLLY